MSEQATKCARCGKRLPHRGDPMPREGFRNVTWLKREVHTYRLRLRIWRFRWMPERAMDRANATDCAVDLCSDCTAGLWLWAQGMDADASKRDGIGRDVVLGADA